MVIFLKTAFSFSPTSIISTNWIVREQFKRGFLKKWLVKNALIKKGLDAITLNREVIYSSSDLYSSDTDQGYNSWLELIVHEHFHRNEIEKLGWVYWYVRYGIESLRFGYRNAPSEKRAYAVAIGKGSVMEVFLKTDLGNEFIAICKNQNLAQEIKNDLIERIAMNAFLPTR